MKTSYISIFALKSSTATTLLELVLFILLIIFLNLSVLVLVDNFSIYLVQLSSTRVKFIIHIQILSIKSIYIVNIQFLSTKPVYKVQILLFAFNLLAEISSISTNYLFLLIFIIKIIALFFN